MPRLSPCRGRLMQPRTARLRLSLRSKRATPAGLPGRSLECTVGVVRPRLRLSLRSKRSLADREGLPSAMRVCAARNFSKVATSDPRVQTRCFAGGSHPSLAVPVWRRWFLSCGKIRIQPFGSRGQGGIRTLGELTPTHAFQACSLDHSDTCPCASSG